MGPRLSGGEQIPSLMIPMRMEMFVNRQSPLVFQVALMAVFLGFDLPCRGADDGDEANPPPENYSGVWVVTEGGAKSEVSYKEGVRHGLAQSWHANGEIGYSAHYRNGVPEGVHASWDDDGLLTDMQVYESNGTRRSIRYGNGHRMQEEVYQGVNLMRRRMWHGAGKKAFDYSCKDGKPHGKITSWHPNGAVRQEGLYENGKEVGGFKCWDENGILTRIINYLDGEIVRIDIYENDKVVAKEHWKNGKAVRTENLKSPPTVEPPR